MPAYDPRDFGPLPTYMAPTTAEVARQRVETLEKAIHQVLDQKFDQICWLDVYTTLGKLVGREFDPTVLPQAVFSHNCQLFSDSLLRGRAYCPDRASALLSAAQAILHEHLEITARLVSAGCTGTTALDMLTQLLSREKSSGSA